MAEEAPPSQTQSGSDPDPLQYWNASDSACNWVGVVCDSTRSFVFSLRLLVAVLVGHIPANTIGNLAQLRILSLRCLQTASHVVSAFCAVDAVDPTVMTSAGLFVHQQCLSVDRPRLSPPAPRSTSAIETTISVCILLVTAFVAVVLRLIPYEYIGRNRVPVFPFKGLPSTFHGFVIFSL
ncbi:hypothetical protein CsSME_00045560 [Camellia sinensis var. sinensis]